MILPTLSTPPTHEEVQAVFKHYAVAYDLMESIQNPRPHREANPRLLPKGDQKTGCIGEYWAMRYARSIWENETECFSFGHHSQKGWDIEVKISGKEPRYIQVKTASEFGKGKLGAIRRPDRSVKDRKGKTLPDYWDELWIIHLDRTLFPIGFWRIEGPDDIAWPETPTLSAAAASGETQVNIIRGKTVPSLAGDRTRPWITKSLPNQIEKFRTRLGLSLD